MQNPLSSLVGREDQLDSLLGFLERVADGRGGVVLVEAAPGHGKTHLIEAATERTPRGLTVIRAKADPLERHRPFGPLRVALGITRHNTDPGRRAVGKLLAGAEPPGRGPVQLGHVSDTGFRAVEAVADLIQDLAAEPTILILDDLHSADHSTLLVLRQLGRRTRFAPLGLVLTYRPPDPGSELQQLIDGLTADGVTHLALEPLTPDAVDRLVLEAVGVPAGPSLSPALAGAAGSPLYVTELLRALRAEDGVVVEHGRAELRSGSLPIGFVDTVRRRVAAHAPATIELLSAAAIAGTDFTPTELALVLGRPETDVIGPLDDAVRDGLLVQLSDRLAFRHDLVRRAIYEGIPTAIRKARHRALADALETANAPIERTAWHMSCCSEPPDPSVAAWLRKAAAVEATRAPSVAAELLRRALEFAPDDSPDRAAMAADRAAELVWAGDIVGGATLAREVLQTMPADLHLRSVLALALLLGGQYGEAVREIEIAIGDPGIDEQARAQLHAESSLARFLSGDLEGAAREGSEALAEGRRLGDDLAVCVGLCALSWTYNGRGELDRALECAEEAVRTAEASTGPAVSRYSPHLFLGLVLMGTPRLDDAERVLRHALAIAESTGTLLNLPAHHACLAFVLMDRGHWDDADAECLAGLRAADDMSVGVGRVWLHAIRAYIAVHRDNPSTARAAIEAADNVLATTGPQIGVDWLMCARALLAELDDPGTAATILENAWDLYEALGVRSHRAPLGPDLVRLALGAGRTDRAGAVAATLALAPDPRSQALATQAAASLEPSVDRRIASLAIAAGALESSPRPLEAARAFEAYAVALADGGRNEEARTRFDMAAKIYEHLGATRPLARLYAAQRAAGIVRGARGPRRRASHGWDSLTETETRVVDLVRGGLTNREVGERLYVSRRTVETHVAHVFTKLGITSRRQLLQAPAPHLPSDEISSNAPKSVSMGTRDPASP